MNRVFSLGQSSGEGEARPVPGEILVLILDIEIIDDWFLLHGLGPAASRSVRSAGTQNTLTSYLSLR